MNLLLNDGHSLSTNGANVLVDPTKLNGAIHAAARYLVHATGDDGQFVYRVYLDTHATGKPRYNMLRHAGSMFALANYYRHYPAPDVLTALERQADFLHREGIGPVDADSEMLAIWSRPTLTGAPSPTVAKLGGAGLGLVALVSVENICPGTTELEHLRGLGRFVVYMQKSDGGFYSKFIPSEGGRSDKWTSLYYPGEAVLGLVMLYEIDRSTVWLDSAAKGMALLARSRQGRQAVEADHWALLATQRLLAHRQQFEHIVTERDLILHASQICRSILNQRHQHANHSPLSGSFMADGRTCPTATRLEGLQAARTFLHNNEELSLSRFSAAVDLGISFLLRTQIPTGPYAGGMPRALGRLPETPQFANFNRRAGEVRIDYVQHALSAMLQYERLRGADISE